MHALVELIGVFFFHVFFEGRVNSERDATDVALVLMFFSRTVSFHMTRQFRGLKIRLRILIKNFKTFDYSEYLNFGIISRNIIRYF